MKISIRSWHYRLVEFWFWENKPLPINLSLCGYFWRVVASCIISPTFVAVFLAVIAPVALVVALIVVPIHFTILYWNREKEPTERRPGLLRSWLAAKKAEVCPIIEWDD